MSVFKKKILRFVSDIPKGTTMSYGTVARKAGYPNAYRAVGSIMAHNINPSVPCHRVVKSDGSLGNYNRGGVRRKKQLLEEEGVPVIGSAEKYRIRMY